MPPGVTTNASDMIMKWCSREKNVRCSKACVTNGFTSCSKGSSMLMPTERRSPVGIGGVRAFVGRLHQAGTAAGEDVAAHPGQLRGELLHAFVRGRAGLEARGAEDGHAIVLPRGAAQAGEVVDDLPQSADGAFEDADGGVFVAEFDDVGLAEGWGFAWLDELSREKRRSAARAATASFDDLLQNLQAPSLATAPCRCRA